MDYHSFSPSSPDTYYPDIYFSGGFRIFFGERVCVRVSYMVCSLDFIYFESTSLIYFVKMHCVFIL